MLCKKFRSGYRAKVQEQILINSEGRRPVKNQETEALEFIIF